MIMENLTVFIYEPELNYLKWLVLQKPEIETGGDLFGLWQNENTAVVQFVLGPGKGCQRTITSFYQDVTYLGEVGGYFTKSQGLCNIGEWHSHHTLGLAEPSDGDQSTVWSHMAGEIFLVFIANISGHPQEVNIGCFQFNSRKQKMITGKIKCLPLSSPLRQTIAYNLNYVESGAEPRQGWETFKKADNISGGRSRPPKTARPDAEGVSSDEDEETALLPPGELSEWEKLLKRIRSFFSRLCGTCCICPCCACPCCPCPCCACPCCACPCSSCPILCDCPCSSCPTWCTGCCCKCCCCDD